MSYLYLVRLEGRIYTSFKTDYEIVLKSAIASYELNLFCF